jgi:hypothetical protein
MLVSLMTWTLKSSLLWRCSCHIWLKFLSVGGHAMDSENWRTNGDGYIHPASSLIRPGKGSMFLRNPRKTFMLLPTFWKWGEHLKCWVKYQWSFRISIHTDWGLSFFTRKSHHFATENVEIISLIGKQHEIQSVPISKKTRVFITKINW